MGRLLLLGVLLSLLMPLMFVASPSSAQTTDVGSAGCPDIPPVRVAILYSTAYPAYVTGVLNNHWELAYELLSPDPMLEVMVVTSWDISTGALEQWDVDVLVLIDNVPEEYADDTIKAWWEDGGAIVALDSSLEFLCYAGILPAASEGSNGEGTYWSYSTSDTAEAVELGHPILRGCRDSFFTLYTGFGGYFEDALGAEPEGAYITKVAQDANDHNLMTITAYDPPDKGRIAHIWFSIWDSDDDCVFYEPFLPKILRNAVKWAGKLVMTLSLDVSDTTPEQGEVIELYAYVEDERGYPLTGACVWAVVGHKTVYFRFSTTAPFRYVAPLDTSELLGEQDIHVYAYVEGLGTLYGHISITVSGRFLVEAYLDDATPVKGDVIRAYVRVRDYGQAPVEDATVTIIIEGTSITASHVADGLYVADIDTSDLSGPVTATVRVEKEGFEAKEVPLTFTVVEPAAPPKPSLAEQLTGPLGLIALTGLAFGILGLLMGILPLIRR